MRRIKKRGRRIRRVRRNRNRWRTVDGKMRVIDQRGKAIERRRRKQFLLDKHGDGKKCPCSYCGKDLDFKSMTVDRVIPGFKGGTYRRENCVPSCSECNIERYVKDDYGHSVDYRKNPRRKRHINSAWKWKR